MVCTPLVSPLFYPAGIHGLVKDSLYQLHWIRWWWIRILDWADFFDEISYTEVFFHISFYFPNKCPNKK